MQVLELLKLIRDIFNLTSGVYPQYSLPSAKLVIKFSKKSYPQSYPQ